MKKLAIIGLIIGLFSVQTLNAQEKLIGLQNNPELLDKDLSSMGTITRSATSIPLPFIDDFAKAGPYPDQAKWKGIGVFINSNFVLNMPTVGVATFDAIDGTGKLYDVAGTFSKPADTLTSSEIDLSYTAADNVILSFYFQAGGLGDMPESADSLTLQFLNSSNEWVNVWSASANQRDSSMTEQYHTTGQVLVNKSDDLSAEFFLTYIRIDRPEYLYDGFRFRFFNYASIAVNSFVSGRASNADHWHLDVVYINRARTEGDYIPDVALSIPQLPLSSRYESIPWKHCNSSTYNQMFPGQLSTNFTLTNLGLSLSSVGLNIRIRPLLGNGENYAFSAGQHNIPNVGETKEYPVIMPNYSFYSDHADSATFEVASYIITDNDASTLRREFRNNDTTRYVHKFYDYYAYDDGTAENGYGLYGGGASTGRVAVKFQNFVQDSLRGVYLYFNRTINDINSSNKIKLAVWADNGAGQPGELLYVQDTVRPSMSGEPNKFVPYKFSHALSIGYNQIFYVGWMQTSEDFVNIGFDRNRNRQDKLFYYLNGAWHPSVYEGALMLRPIFATNESEFPPNPVLPPVQSSISEAVTPVPNPASSTIRLHWAESQAEPLKSKVELYDMRGRLVKTQQVSYGESVNVSTLSEGIYFIRIYDGKNKPVETSKVIIKK
ncbi:MAG: T9SS type A sorting domain-containing protein [Prevotellaceae bacterium]|jgi:hypothetical protein|nr:T9SS type A sorting domain-containing protein [Prevotellaceae bacterium]